MPKGNAWSKTSNGPMWSLVTTPCRSGYYKHARESRIWSHTETRWKKQCRFIYSLSRFINLRMMQTQYPLSALATPISIYRNISYRHIWVFLQYVLEPLTLGFNYNHKNLRNFVFMIKRSSSYWTLSSTIASSTYMNSVYAEQLVTRDTEYNYAYI